MHHDYQNNLKKIKQCDKLFFECVWLNVPAFQKQKKAIQ